VGDERSDVAELGGVRLEKLAACGNAIKEIGDADGGARGQPGRLDADELASGEFDAGAFGFGCVARFEQQTRDGGDGGKRFTAKAERGDGEEIVGGAELAGGVALEGEERVVVGHAVAVVNDADHAPAAGFGFDADAGHAPEPLWERPDCPGLCAQAFCDVASSLGGRGFSPGVEGTKVGALAPEEDFEKRSGIGSRSNLPEAEEYGQPRKVWTRPARTGFMATYSAFPCQSSASRIVQS